MARAFAEITFTPSVLAAQQRYGSKTANQRLLDAEDPGNRLGLAEAEFIIARDSFYIASVNEDGWPYVQHRGGPAGFLKIIDEGTIGFADYRGNRQYLTVGNINADARVSLILMDYANRRRLKIWGHSRIVHAEEDAALLTRLEDPHYRSRVERGMIISISALEWNCPQHITPRYSATELDALAAKGL